VRRVRKIRKTVKVIVPNDATVTRESRISRGKVRDNIVKKVVSPAQINPKTGKPRHTPYHTPKTFKKVKPIWKGETVYLIGGGPSLKGFEWNRLKDKKTIAINKAVKFWPNADVMYWTDGRVWTWLEEDIKNYKGLKFTIAPRRYPDDVHLLRRGKKYGIETSPDCIAHSNNSGGAAINLAIHLGAKRIVLLGYDMGNDGRVSHFHDGYPSNATGENIYKNQFMPAFEAIKEHLKGKDIQIYNACPTSKLNTFKKITIDEALSFR
jgi:hypothetical protein